MNMKPLHAKCDQCPLRDAPLVPSFKPDGEIKLVIVGEAPNASDVHHGKPFSGPGGQLLDKALAHNGIDPSTVYRTHACLCCPSGNTAPTAQAIQCCSERLRDDLSASGDVPILTLGAAAMAAVDAVAQVTDPATITHRRGASYRYGLRSYVPTLHPSYILRKPNEVKYLLSDIKAVVNPETQPIDFMQTKYAIATPDNIDRIMQYIDSIPDNAIVSFDVETDHLQWYSTPALKAADLLCIVIAAELDKAVIIPADLVGFSTMAQLQTTQKLRAFFRRVRLVAHNGKFDQHVMQANGMPVKLYADTLLTQYLLDETKGGKGLKELAAHYFNVPDYESDFVDAEFKKLKIKQADRRYSLLPKDKLYRYAAIDGCVTLALYHKLYPQIVKQDLARTLFDVLMPGNIAVQATEHNGAYVDVDYLRKAQIKLSTEVARIETEMRQFITPLVTAYMQHDYALPRGKGTDWIKDVSQYTKVLEKCLNINVGSWQQVQVVLYDVLRLRHVKKLSYKSSPRSTDEEAQLALEPHPFVDLLTAHRRVSKILGTYVEKLLSMADVNGRVHINFLLHGTEIGRLSATDAMHGIPRPSDEYGAIIRGAFIAPKGRKLILADYSQAELRTFAAASGEPTMLDAFNNDRDPHDETAKLIADDVASYFKWNYNDPAIPGGIKKEIRTLSKNVNFGEIYQGGPNGIAAMLGGKIPIAIVSKVLAVKREKQQTAAQYCADQLTFARSHGYVRTRFGRYRRFPLITPDNLDEIKKACVHMPTASNASDCLLLSAYECVQHGYMTIHMVHDSILIECDEADAETIRTHVETIMVDTASRYFPEVKWAADVEIADCWCSEAPKGSYYAATTRPAL
jgi:uracil-DNA glycosylase family 4